jgi:hypothetical protein
VTTVQKKNESRAENIRNHYTAEIEKHHRTPIVLFSERSHHTASTSSIRRSEVLIARIACGSYPQASDIVVDSRGRNPARPISRIVPFSACPEASVGRCRLSHRASVAPNLIVVRAGFRQRGFEKVCRLHRSTDLLKHERCLVEVEAIRKIIRVRVGVAQ